MRHTLQQQAAEILNRHLVTDRSLMQYHNCREWIMAENPTEAQLALLAQFIDMPHKQRRAAVFLPDSIWVDTTRDVQRFRIVPYRYKRKSKNAKKRKSINTVAHTER